MSEFGDFAQNISSNLIWKYCCYVRFIDIKGIAQRCTCLGKIIQKRQEIKLGGSHFYPVHKLKPGQKWTSLQTKDGYSQILQSFTICQNHFYQVSIDCFKNWFVRSCKSLWKLLTLVCSGWPQVYTMFWANSLRESSSLLANTVIGP